MKRLFMIPLFFIAACNNAAISFEEMQKMDTLSNTDYNRLLRK
jgi:hypothetical protein